MTGRINPAVVSFLAGRQPKERLRLIDARSPIAQAHIFVGSNKTPGLGMSVLSTILGGSCWQVSVDAV